MENVTAIVISFLRPAYTIACLESLRKHYPTIQILVGENGHYDKNTAEVCRQIDARYIKLEFDSGVCVARNQLTKLVNTDYILVGDDDFYYTGDERLLDMLLFLSTHDTFDLIGGRIRENGKVRNYQGYIEKIERHFVTTALDVEKAEYKTTRTEPTFRYCPADLTFNFFIARTEKVKQVPWDAKIKVAYEHYSWFWDFKQAGNKVAFTPDAIVIHKPEHINVDTSNEYRTYRSRQSDRERFFERHGIDYTIDMNGNTNYGPNHKIERTKNDTKCVDFCITTFKRPHALERLLLSIAKHYPMANVYIADQNETYDRQFYRELKTRVQEAGLIKRPAIYQLPYDCGLSYARNHLVTKTPNKYKLILDDDMEFTAKTDIGKMVKLLDANPRAGIVGGALEQLGYPVNFEFNIEIKEGTILQVPDGNRWKQHEGIRYKQTGCVLNFALMRSDIFNLIRWDDNLKVTEHLDFYIRMKRLAYAILYTPDCVIDHPPVERKGDYKEFRQRPEFQVRMLRKHGANRVKYLNGQVTELKPDGSLLRYKEQNHG